MKMFVAVSLLTAALSGSPPIVSAGGEYQAPRQPQLFVSSDGVVHLTFGDGNCIYYSNSRTSSPLTFSKPVRVAETPNLALGMRRGPRVAASGRTVAISAISGTKGKGRDENLLAWRSTDDGMTWHGATTVNDAPAAAREGLHAMAVGNGTFACAWIDLRTKQPDLRVATSVDGETWSPNVIAYQSPSGRVCECCQPSLAFDDKGQLHLLWRNSLEGFRDMYRSISKDGGKTFETAVKLGLGSWALNACPMDGGGIAVRGGRVDTAWRRERIVYATFGNDGEEIRQGDGEQPCIAPSANGSVVIWLKRRPGELLLRSEKDLRPRVLANHAIDPVAASTIDGRRVVVAWEGAADQKPAIFAEVIERDGGQ